jgi:sulfite oxidase
MWSGGVYALSATPFAEPSQIPARRHSSTAPAIQDTPVQSAICEPKNGDIISHDEEEITLKGFAYAGGGRAIIRVDVSSDGGKTWRTAELLQDPKQKEEYNRMWGWTLWEATVPMPTDAKDGASVELICKATDSAYNDQPDTVAPTWNLRGVLTHSWHRVNIRVE